MVSCLQMGVFLQFTDRATLTGFRKTADGYLAGNVLCARTGCQQYLASEVGLMGDGVVTVYRSEDVVFDKASLATYAGKPVTLNHPPEAVTADNWKQYAAGMVGDEIARDGDFVRVPLVLMDADVIAAVDAGTREISMGYTTGIAMQDGVAPDGTAYQAVQTGPIKINHLAIVPRARGGEKLRIGDNAQSWGAAPLIVGDKGGLMADRKITWDGVPFHVDEAGEAVFAKLTKTISDMSAKLKAAEEEEEKAKAKMDAAIAAKDAADAAKITPAQLDAMVAARVDLIGKARAIVADFDASGKSDADIRKAVVAAKLGDEAIAGKSDGYVEGSFDYLAQHAGKADPFKDAKPVIKSDESLAAVYAARDERLKNAWKGEAK